MTKSIGDILESTQYAKPDEIEAIKDFVQKKTQVLPGVSVTNESFIIRMPNAASAGALRFQINNLKKELRTKKRLTIRIGS